MKRPFEDIFSAALLRLLTLALSATGIRGLIIYPLSLKLTTDARSPSLSRDMKSFAAGMRRKCGSVFFMLPELSITRTTSILPALATAAGVRAMNIPITIARAVIPVFFILLSPVSARASFFIFFRTIRVITLVPP